VPLSPTQSAARRAADAYFGRLEDTLTRGRQALHPSPATGNDGEDPAGPAPPSFRRRWAAACHAELAHARNDWARLVAAQGAGWCQDEQAAWGAHPSERYRLPHEWAAAAVIGGLGHLQAFESGWHAARRWRPLDRDYLRDLLVRRRTAWTQILASIARYRAARGDIDRPGRLASSAQNHPD
jgi:hypothetical protein